MEDKVLFPNEKIIVTEYFDIHQDWEVPISGFFIVACIRKVSSIAEFTDQETTEFIKLVKKVRQGMKEALGIKEVYFFYSYFNSLFYKKFDAIACFSWGNGNMNLVLSFWSKF